MALGKPVVGTYSGGMADQVVDGETGYLVHVGDHVGLAQRIIDLLSDHDRRNRMGAAARMRLRSHFPLQSMLAKFDGELADMASSTPSNTRDGAADDLLSMATHSRLIRAEDRVQTAANRTIRRIHRAKAAGGKTLGGAR
jgi:hypothetical protein